MAVPRPPEQALFFCGILAADEALLAPARGALEERFGPASRASAVFPFSHTDYYLRELGPAPVRLFLAWESAYPTETIADAKTATNAMETTLAATLRECAPGLARPVNLDPGYLTRAKLVLASAKNYSHRIHVRGGIYAEITLQYRDGKFQTLPWTFPDFADARYHAFFLGLRKKIPTITV